MILLADIDHEARRMNVGYDLLLEIIENIGPIALFLVLCLGLIGLPIPNEAVILTAGALSEADVIDPTIAFAMVTLGICSAMTFNYSLGRFTSSSLGAWFSKKQNVGKFVGKSDHLIDKYGLYAIPISLFFPFVRHATPYVMGMNSMKYSKFSLIAFPAAAFWTSIYFTLGHFVGDRIPEIIALTNQYEALFLILGAVMISILFLRGYRRYKLKHSSHNQVK